MADIETYLKTIRDSADGESVRDAIIKCMNDINSDVAVTLYPFSKSLTFTQNGTYTNTYPAQRNAAMSKATFTVTVDVDGGGGGGSGEQEAQALTHVDATIDNDTQNGEYPPSAFGGDVIDNVIVNLDVYKPDDVVDNITISLSDLDEMNGYSATEYGYNAMKRITIQAEDIAAARGGTVGPGGVIYFKVTFYKNEEMTQKITTISVPSGKSALNYVSINNSDIINPYADKEFTGWESADGGDPYKVTQDMRCRPSFSYSAPAQGDIQESWEYIAAHPGEYGIGSMKTIKYNVKVPARGIKWLSIRHNATVPGDTRYQIDNQDMFIFSGNYKMVLIAKGENGTGTTWMSQNSLPSICSSNRLSYTYASNGLSENVYLQDIAPLGYSNISYDSSTGVDDWRSSFLRYFLNNVLYTYMPSDLRGLIKEVTNYQRGLADPENTNYVDLSNPNKYETNAIKDHIWVPAISQFYIGEETWRSGTTSTGVQDWDNNLTQKEANVYDYTANQAFTDLMPAAGDTLAWVASPSVLCATRSLGSGYYGNAGRVALVDVGAANGGGYAVSGLIAGDIFKIECCRFCFCL